MMLRKGSRAQKWTWHMILLMEHSEQLKRRPTVKNTQRGDEGRGQSGRGGTFRGDENVL